MYSCPTNVGWGGVRDKLKQGLWRRLTYGGLIGFASIVKPTNEMLGFDSKLPTSRVISFSR